MSAPLDTLFAAETPEGIALTQRPAGVVPRSLAYVIDFGIRVVVMIVASMVLAWLGGMGQAAMLILYFLLEWFYPVAFELALGGATPGKRILGLAVAMDSGLPLTPAASLVRNLLRAADFLPAFYAFGLVTMMLRRDFKRIGDLAAGTLVVYVQRVDLHAALPEAPPQAPARPLSSREQASIVSWAGRVPRLTAERADELAAIAEPILPAIAGTAARDRTARLLGVAHWLMGRR